MRLFRNKYKARIEARIVDLVMQRAFLKAEEANISSLKPKERVHFIILRSECEKKIELLKSLL